MRRNDDGYVTAETAVVLPVLVLVLLVALGLLSAVSTQLRCYDAAREGARAAALGEPASVVRARAGAVAPAGATVSIATGPEATVTVVVRVRAVPLLPVLGVEVSGRSVAAVEPGVPR